eukprot:150385_1
MGGDMLLNNITFKDLRKYKMILNGDLFTFDPDFSTNSHLGFDWQCTDNINTNKSCDHLFNSMDKSIVNADFNRIPLHETNLKYSYTFALEVYDKSNMYRERCFDSVQFNTNIINDTNVSVISLFISTTAISNRINEYDKVRIIANVINDIDVVYEYRWFEINELLTDQEIIMYSESSTNSLNLILKPNILTVGLTYSFKLEIFKYDSNNKLIAYGISTETQIYVMTGPRIIANSFVISPECPNGVTVYDTINDYMENIYSLSVIADGDVLPLLYQFMYNNNRFFHPNLLSTPYIDNIQLPIGENTLFVNVYDAQATLTTDSIQCNVMLNSYSECIDKNNIFGDIDLYITEYERYLYILQTANVYLLYLTDNKNTVTNIDQCLQDTLSIILDTIYNNINGDTLCENNINFIILLSDVLKLWMDLVDFDSKLMKQFYKANDNKMQLETVIYNSLDPCDYITNEIGYKNIEKLTVSTESIIKNIVKIYYKKEDITQYLSPIEINDNYKHLLYALSSPIIQFIKYTNNHNIYNLLASALHIASLSAISTSIPGEELVLTFDEFSLFTSRVSNNNNNITITIQNISVYIPNDILFTKKK